MSDTTRSPWPVDEDVRALVLARQQSTVLDAQDASDDEYDDLIAWHRELDRWLDVHYARASVR